MAKKTAGTILKYKTIFMPKRQESYFYDIINNQFGLLYVDEYLGNRTYLCKCDCGNEKIITRNALISDSNTSCGCQKGKKKNNHNKSKTSEHRVWSQMKNRCYNIKNGAYKYYGERGITVDARWLNKPNGFINFLEDMGERPSLKYTLDRIDNDKGYCPENCRWATSKEQGNNKRNTIKIEYKGEVKTLIEWGEIYNIHPKTLLCRIQANWELELALTTANSQGKKIYFNKSVK